MSPAHVLVARQPIFDRQLHVYAYRLLFRADSERNGQSGSAGKRGLLTRSFLMIGLDSLTGGKRAFIRFNPDQLLKRVPTAFPKNEIAVEIQEPLKSEPDIIMACFELKKAGYLMVMNDFVLRPQSKAFLQMTDVIKVDFRRISGDARHKLMELVLPKFRQIRFLAENVESYEEFQEALEMGYTFVQGPFYTHPQHSEGQERGDKMNYIQVLFEVNQPQISLEKLGSVVSRDDTLSEKLLTYVNSAYFGLRHKVSSVRHALAILGEREVRNWASLVALQSVGQDKPPELAMQCAVRAKFCEQLATPLGLESRSPEFYLLGLFSDVDAFLDRPRDEILEEVPIPEDVKKALSGQEAGKLGQVYQLVTAYETGDWNRVSELSHQLRLSESTVFDLYRKALTWADNIFHMQG